MIDEAQVRIITKKVLDEEHLLGYIKIFEKEHNLFRGSHDKIQLPAALEVPQQVVNYISGKTKLEDLEDVSIPAKTVGDFIQYNETTERWTRQAALTQGQIIFPDASGYFTGDSNLFWDDSNKRLGVGFNVPVARVHIRGAECTDYAGLHPDTILLIENDDSVGIQLQCATDGSAYLVFADDDYNPPAGRIEYDFTDTEMVFTVGGNVALTIYQPATSGATFAGMFVQVDSPGLARFIADSHDADAYLDFQEDNASKWTIGFDYTDSLKFQISEGIPGTNVRFEIEPSGIINCYVDLALRDNQELRFYDNGNYVGFKAPALGADQIWVLPAADGPANEVLGTDNAGNLIWRSFSEIAGYAPSADEKVKVDTGATADYLGAASNDGCLRTDGTQITYTDGGNFVTLTTAQAIDATASPTFVGLTLSGETYLYGDIHSDRYLESDLNVFIGVRVAGAGTLEHTAGNEGWHNVGIGYDALRGITKGYMNVAVGTDCLRVITTGYYNVGLGYASLYKVTTGYHNMGIGGNALLNTVGGANNVAVGKSAMADNVSGSDSVGVGSGALYKGLAGTNVGIGTNAGGENQNGWANVCIGYECGRLGTLVYLNTYIGSQAAWNNFGNNNVGIGYRCMYGTGASGAKNVVLGALASFAGTTASNNVIIGFEAAENITTGNGNVVIGYMCAEGQLTTGSNQLWIHNSDAAVPLIYGEFDNLFLKINNHIYMLERSADPTEPAEGEMVIWLSDGTQKGDDGDVLIASKAAGQTNVNTIHDHSAGAAW